MDINVKEKKMQNKSRGILCMLASALAFTFMGVAVKSAGSIPVFKKYFLGILLVFLWHYIL